MEAPQPPHVVLQLPVLTPTLSPSTSTSTTAAAAAAAADRADAAAAAGSELDGIIRRFIASPAPLGSKVFCHIVRRRTALAAVQAYELYLEQPEQPPRLLLCARKARRTRGALYKISLDRNDFTSPHTVVARVRSNVTGSQFVVSDNGRNALRDRADAPGERPDRSELAAVLYEPNAFGLKGPRRMTILMPPLGDTPWLVHQEDDSLVRVFQANPQGWRDRMLLLYNKVPHWSGETNSYVLNFHGRVTQPSVKNFQLTHPDDLDYITLQFGRTGEDTFTMDYQYPLTCMQAFGIALSSFHGKFGSE